MTVPYICIYWVDVFDIASIIPAERAIYRM